MVTFTVLKKQGNKLLIIYIENKSKDHPGYH